MKNASESDPCVYEATKTVAKKGPEIYPSYKYKSINRE